MFNALQGALDIFLRDTALQANRLVGSPTQFQVVFFPFETIRPVGPVEGRNQVGQYRCPQVDRGFVVPFIQLDPGGQVQPACQACGQFAGQVQRAGGDFTIQRCSRERQVTEKRIDRIGHEEVILLHVANCRPPGKTQFCCRCKGSGEIELVVLVVRRQVRAKCFRFRAGQERVFPGDRRPAVFERRTHETDTQAGALTGILQGHIKPLGGEIDRDREVCCVAQEQAGAKRPGAVFFLLLEIQAVRPLAGEFQCQAGI